MSNPSKKEEEKKGAFDKEAIVAKEMKKNPVPPEEKPKDIPMDAKATYDDTGGISNSGTRSDQN